MISKIEKGEYVIGIAIILAAILIAATIYISFSNVQKVILSKSSAETAKASSLSSPSQPTQSVPKELSFTKEVTLDFLYADWCPHCQKMKPIVAKLEGQLPAERFTVRKWRDEDKNTPPVASVYSYYIGKGLFRGGFPTFIINGDERKEGEMSEAAFKDWVCSKFSSPKPTACA
ncbi:MAG: thioredoxin family protein [Candidatus Micrarchaeota archaeon]|nr:thioredoxin family protein [Candidatus Micrarchaeota archaeon]